MTTLSGALSYWPSLIAFLLVQTVVFVVGQVLRTAVAWKTLPSSPPGTCKSLFSFFFNSMKIILFSLNG